MSPEIMLSHQEAQEGAQQTSGVGLLM